jgi:CheY-like chemotaxis protein
VDQSPHSSGERAEGKLILLADDEPSVLRLGERVLKSAGFRVLLAKDGYEAIELFREHAQDIDAVILDMGMPGADGVATLEAIRAINPGPQSSWPPAFLYTMRKLPLEPSDPTRSYRSRIAPCS